MNTLSLESGKVCVEGDVVAVTSRTLAKRGSAALAFDITDRSNSIKVTRFLRAEDDQSVVEKIHEGDHVEYMADEDPKLGDILNIKNSDTSVMIYYEGKEFAIPSAK